MEEQTIQIPKDVKEMTEKYKIDKGGICGQSCLAVIENITIKEVLDNWESLGLEFKGYSGWKQLREYLEKRGHKVKLLRMSNLGSFNYNFFYICRVQWLGEKDNKEKPFYGWGHWTEASAHTHFIVIHQGKFFCNEEGIFDYHDLGKYLDNAEITSIMEVQNINGVRFIPPKHKLKWKSI